MLVPVLGQPAQTPSPSFERKGEFVASDGDVTKVLIVDDRALVVGIGPYTLYVWSIDRGAMLSQRTVQYPENRLRDVTVCASGKVLAYLVSGDQSEVVFASFDTGQRVDVRTGEGIVGPAPTDKPGVGSWRLAAPGGTGAAIPIPRAVSLKETSPGRLASVAVAYSSGAIQVLDVGTGIASTVNTGMTGLREVTFNQQGAVAWAGANGYGTLNADGKPANTEFPNSSARLTANQWVMLSRRDGGLVVRTHDIKGAPPKDTFWKATGVEIDALQPFGQRYFAMYSNGEVELRDAAGTPLGARVTLPPAVTMSGIHVTDIAVSPRGRVAVARGRVVTAYQISGTVGR